MTCEKPAKPAAGPAGRVADVGPVSKIVLLWRNAAAEQSIGPNYRGTCTAPIYRLINTTLR